MYLFHLFLSLYLILLCVENNIHTKSMQMYRSVCTQACIFMLSTYTSSFHLLAHNTGSLSSSLCIFQCPLDAMYTPQPPQSFRGTHTVHNTRYEHISAPLPARTTAGTGKPGYSPLPRGRTLPAPHCPHATGRASCQTCPAHSRPPLPGRFPPRTPPARQVTPGQPRRLGRVGRGAQPRHPEGNGGRTLGRELLARRPPCATAQAGASPRRGDGGGVGGAGPARLPGRRLGLRPRTAPTASGREAGWRRGAAPVPRRGEEAGARGRRCRADGGGGGTGRYSLSSGS